MVTAAMQPPTKTPKTEAVSFIELPPGYVMPDELEHLGGLTPSQDGARRWWPAADSKMWKVPQRSDPTYYFLILAGIDHAEYWIRASTKSGCPCFDLFAAERVPQRIRSRVARLK